MFSVCDHYTSVSLSYTCSLSRSQGCKPHNCPLTSLVAQMIKKPPAMQETQVPSLGGEDPLEKQMATHSSVPAWKIPWTEESGGLQLTGSQRVGHD